MPKRLTPRGQAAPPVEPIITGATLPPKKTPVKRPAKAKTSDIKYVRNLHHIESHTRLNTGRTIDLKPRGQREDLDIVNPEEQQDPRFLANKDLLFEVIEPEVAQQIIASQRTNTNQEEHSLWRYLRNEQGQPYQQRAHRIEEAFERQGTVVGQIEQTGAGRFTDKNFTVTRAAGPEIVDVPGSPNHPATKLASSIPTDISPEEYHEFLLWKQLRARMAREALNVSVEPVESDEEVETEETQEG